MPMGQMDFMFPIVAIGFVMCFVVFGAALFFSRNIRGHRSRPREQDLVEEERRRRIEGAKTEIVAMIEEALERHREPRREDESAVTAA